MAEQKLRTCGRQLQDGCYLVRPFGWTLDMQRVGPPVVADFGTVELLDDLLKVADLWSAS